MTTESCEEIPMTTMVESWKFKKTAASMPRFGTVAGLALPPALALDYMYNKWRYGDMADVKAEQPGMGGHGAQGWTLREGASGTDHDR